ncbi:hypothetical protein ACQ4PT_071950 [Festuca glaucescens]
MASTASTASPSAAADPPPSPSLPGDARPDPDPDPDLISSPAVAPVGDGAVLAPAAQDPADPAPAAPAALAKAAPAVVTAEVAVSGASPAGPSALLAQSRPPPPPAELTRAAAPGAPPAASGAPGDVAQVWEKVGGRRRSRTEKGKGPASPPKKESGLSIAFKRRTFGLCFRCLAEDHFIAECQGSVRCLGCRHSGHLERECKANLAAGRAPRPRAVPASTGHATCNEPPPAPPHRHGRTWASAVAHQDSLATVGATPTTAPSMPPVDLGSLQPLLAAQAEALSAELQAMFAARLELLFKPLQDLVAAVECWTVQVSSLWEPMEDSGGCQDLTNEEHAPPAVADGEDGCALDVAGCSAELSETVQSVDVPPAFDKVLQGVVPPGKQQQAQAQPSNDMMMAEVALPSSSTKLDEFWSSFKSTAQYSLLDAPIQVQFEGDSSCVERRSGRLDKKNKDCNIPVAKRVEYRLAESFGDPPKGPAPKKGSAEDVQEKMKTLLRLCKKPASPLETQASRELILANV